jgi:hypothetical protein
MNSFMNDRKWTNLDIQPQEKIECAIRLLIEKSETQDIYEGKLYVNLSRHVFNSFSYATPLLSFQDNYIKFRYASNQTFDYEDGSYLWTITSVLAYYANLFLGITFDSYASSGGTPFFSKCLDIVSSAPNSEIGWNMQKVREERRNRYELLTAFTNPSYSAMREIVYTYHRLGLDMLAQDLPQGIQNISESIDALAKLYSSHSNLAGILIFCETKAQEFVNIYSGQNAEVRRKIATILSKLNPSNSSLYEKMTAG